MVTHQTLIDRRNKFIEIINEEEADPLIDMDDLQCDIYQRKLIRTLTNLFPEYATMFGCQGHYEEDCSYEEAERLKLFLHPYILLAVPSWSELEWMMDFMRVSGWMDARRRDAAGFRRVKVSIETSAVKMLLPVKRLGVEGNELYSYPALSVHLNAEAVTELGRSEEELKTISDHLAQHAEELLIEFFEAMRVYKDKL